MNSVWKVTYMAHTRHTRLFRLRVILQDTLKLSLDSLSLFIFESPSKLPYKNGSIKKFYFQGGSLRWLYEERMVQVVSQR